MVYTWDQGLGLGTGTWGGSWDLGAGTWDLGPGIWDRELGTWDLGLWTYLEPGTWDWY